MTDDAPRTPAPGGDKKIEPVDFRAPARTPGSSAGAALKWTAVLGLCLVLSGLGAAGFFVFTAQRVTFAIQPAPDRVSVTGGPWKLRWGDGYLLRPGTYTVTAEKQCYEPLVIPLQVAAGNNPRLAAALEKQPGRLTVDVRVEGSPDQRVTDARIRIDDRDAGGPSLAGEAVPAGRRRLTVQAAGYRTFEETVDIEGCDRTQTVIARLEQGWADVTIRTEPPGADIRVDGISVGTTPATIAVAEGDHDLRLEAPGYKPHVSRLAVVAGQDPQTVAVQLAKADGRLSVTSTPSGATVVVGQQYVGRTPLETHLPPAVAHRVTLTKSGYDKAVRTVTVASGKTESLDVPLTAAQGIVRLNVRPDDAQVIVDGGDPGRVTPELRLDASTHLIEIRKDGYRPFRTEVTPQPGFPQELTVLLEPIVPTATAPGSAPAAAIQAPNGYPLVRVDPGEFTMGSSRGEQGRRSNETLRRVRLQRPFYMGLREVTNGEFRQFMPDHRSGAVNAHSLDGDGLPVVAVTWDQAARFCNWLSEKAGLPPAYIASGGGLVAVEPPTTGFRLPTEAEWEYCARLAPGGATRKYPWGEGFPPKGSAGNYADASAKDLLANVIAAYDDGFPATAPPGSFAAGPLGLVDMGGNAAEWCHDAYTIHPRDPSAVSTDPTGPPTGKLRVIRGSGWKDAGISALRLAYRDYGEEKRDDVGFRICRYAE